MSDPTKPKICLIPLEFLADIARVMEKGIRDGRQEGDWKKLDDVDLLNACIRHFIAHQSGEIIDAKSGETHMACVATNAFMLMWKHKYGGQQDGDAGDKSKSVCNHCYCYSPGTGDYFCERCGKITVEEPSSFKMPS